MGSPYPSTMASCGLGVPLFWFSRTKHGDPHNSSTQIPDGLGRNWCDP